MTLKWWSKWTCFHDSFMGQFHILQSTSQNWVVTPKLLNFKPQFFWHCCTLTLHVFSEHSGTLDIDSRFCAQPTTSQTPGPHRTEARFVYTKCWASARIENAPSAQPLCAAECPDGPTKTASGSHLKEITSESRRSRCFWRRSCQNQHCFLQSLNWLWQCKFCIQELTISFLF